MKQLILVGFMGAGKTTIGKLLASKLQLPYYDLDSEIEKEQQQRITDLFAKHGEAFFRALETKKLQQLSVQEGIISTGGGIILNEQNRKLLKQQPAVIYLQTSPAIFLSRLTADASRPLIQQKSVAEIEAIYRLRIPLYEAVADHTIATDHKLPITIAQEIIEKTT